ncbi:class I SAM-dependent methyltransferase [Bradyrhizobium sp. 25ACV]
MNARPSFIEETYPELKAGGFDRVDGTVQFYSRVNALLSPDSMVVDFGAGRGGPLIDDPVTYRRQLRMLKGKVREVIGVDVDDVVLTNPGVDRAVVLRGAAIPLEDSSIDLIVSDFTFEHLPDPRSTCTELARILKPGGWICARTPNRNGYISMMNRLISDKIKDRVLHAAQPDRKEEDVFPAHYLVNTLGALTEFFPTHRFEHSTYSWDGFPSYHFNRRLLFAGFRALQAISPSGFKSTLMIFIRKLG